jgi:predicted dinucleotide-binding enzyme
MKIGIIGAGKIGGGLGKLWVRAGHQVLFSSRRPKRLRVLVEEARPGAYVGDVGDAALFGDVKNTLSLDPEKGLRVHRTS